MIIKTNYKDIFGLDQSKINAIDPYINNVLEFWKTDSAYLIVKTSGSTGNPKPIKLKREHIINSANATLDFFDLNKGSSFLCCMPSMYIGGIMMLIRAIVNEGVIFLEKPSRYPIQRLNEKIDLCAMTTAQTRNAIQIPKRMEFIRNLLIGGGELTNDDDFNLSKLETSCFHSFGMTETISHIALRPIDSKTEDKLYQCLNHVQISNNNENRLVIKSKKIGIESLTTNDIVEIVGNQLFKYIGRMGNVINSGGLKIHSEQVEKTLSHHLNSSQFFIDKEPHDEMGEICILICLESISEKSVLEATSHIHNKKLAPKKVYWVKKIHFKSNDKLDRIKTRKEAFLVNNCKSLSSLI